MSRPILAVAACVLALQVAAPGAQQPQQTPAPQTPVFRAGTTIVPLSVSVVDRLGNPVSGLTQDDFTVREGGVVQPIKAFFPRTLTARTPPAMAGSALIRAPRRDPAEALAPATRRTFVLVLGDGRIQEPTKALDGAIEFVREMLLPQDLVAIVAFDRATDFTTDHEQAARVLERYRQRHEAIIREISDFYGCPVCNADKDIPPDIQAHIDAIFTPTPFRSAVNLLIPTGVFDRDWAIPGVRKLEGLPNLGVKQDDQLKLYAAVEYFREIDGDKHAIVLTNKGVMASIGNRFGNWGIWEDELVAKFASGAQVAVNVIKTNGTPARGSRNWAISDLEHITDDTGGQFTGVSYAKDALSRIDQATRFGYLLGYAPTPPEPEDHYRKVGVTVGRPDVVVLFRHGFPADETAASADPEKLTASRLDSAAAFNWEMSDIGIKMTAAVVPGIGINRRVQIDATIDASRVSFTHSGDRYVAALDIRSVCGDAKQRLVCDQQDRIALDLDERAYREALTSGVRYRARVPFEDDATWVKVVAYDYGADLLGTATVKLR